jgi:hypothetical protein
MESCAYCGDEVLDDGVYLDDVVFCSQECLDAFYDERLDFMDDDDVE